MDQWPAPGQALLFADLPYTIDAKGVAEFTSKDPAADSRRLLRDFLQRAYRRPVAAGDVERFARSRRQSDVRGLLVHRRHDFHLLGGPLFAGLCNSRGEARTPR